MFRVIIIGLALVVIFPALNNGELGTAAVAAVIAVVLLLMGASERKDAQAWVNWRDYWAEGGPERRRK